MTNEQKNLADIRTAIKSLPPESQETIEDIAEHFRVTIRVAPDGEGAMALALVGAEMAAQ